MRAARMCLPSAALVLLGSVPAGAPATGARERDLARRILEASGVKGGVIVHLGCGDGRLTADLRTNDSYIVHGLDEDPARVERARRHIASLGIYGPVAVDRFDGEHLPYAENLVNLIVVEDPREGTENEMRRVLAPGGVIMARRDGAWAKTVKPRTIDIDEWSHYLHGPDGNPVAADEVVGPPRHYQWIAGPLWLRDHDTDSSISTVVTANGRIFTIADEAPTSLCGNHDLPDKWCLAARDAFNGILLWKLPIHRWGWREWKATWFKNRPGDFPLNIQKRLVAAGDRVYATLGYHAPVSEIDAAAGRILRTYEGTDETREILVDRGILILSVRGSEGLRILSVRAGDGSILWRSEKTYGGTSQDYIRFIKLGASPSDVETALNIAADEKRVALLDGRDVAAIDRSTGKEMWRARLEDEKGDLWIGTLILADGVVLHASPDRLVALAADTGRTLWERPKSGLGHLWYEWKDVFVIGGRVWTWSAETRRGTIRSGGKKPGTNPAPESVVAYDLATGAPAAQVPLGNLFVANHHHRCYRNRATTRYILASRRGTEFVDLLEGEHSLNNWVRGTCHVGMIPANGLQYAPPHPCQCYLQEKLNGFNALAPEIPARYRRTAAGPPAVERGPAYADVPAMEAGAEDWPFFRHDAERSGSASTRIPARLERLWRTRAGATISPPVIAAGRVFVAAVDEHRVLALRASDGSEAWSHTAGGRVDTPPAYVRGRVIFGSRDGRVTCLRASDGAQAWRIRAAPEDRRIGAFDQLESAWPVHGSVLVRDGRVYFAAGRSSHLDGGIHLYALDAATGEVLRHAKLEGPAYDPREIEINAGLPEGALPDILSIREGSIAMRAILFDGDLRRRDADPRGLVARGGFLDDSYFKRVPWQYGAPGNFARLFAVKGGAAFGVRMFQTLRCLVPGNFFTPGAGGYTFFAQETSDGKMRWSRKLMVRAHALVATDEILFAAGPPDVVDPKDPLGAFEGRKGGALVALDARSGDLLGERALDAPPVFNGMAAAGGRLYIASTDGTLSCFGGPSGY
ncbi:MAG: PQQ-binding-like beta-propeller repeat protein [Planctomycetes bacterium]|nr:PQQ-binding-like beta-propeller repeat protein [Planctomycetota bacterium]